MDFCSSTPEGLILFAALKEFLVFSVRVLVVKGLVRFYIFFKFSYSCSAAPCQCSNRLGFGRKAGPKLKAFGF